jgi:hypothetical protein
MKLNGKHKILALSVLVASGVWFFNACSKSETANVVAETAPVVSFSAGPAAGSTSGPVTTFVFSSTTAGVSYVCVLDGSTLSSCDPLGVALSGLSDGLHTFGAQAISAAGEIGELNSVTWTVDATGPVLNITNPTGSSAVGPVFTLTFTSSDATAVHTCTLDGSVTACSTGAGVAMGPLADGFHQVTVTGVDDYGNQSSELVNFIVDATGPLLAVSEPVASGSYASPKNAIFNSTEAATFYCEIDAGPTVICTSPYAMSLSAGAHQFRVYGVDQFGNTGATVSVNFTIL